MQERSAIQKGWEFSARLAGADAAARLGSAYVSQVQQAIDQLTADIVKLKSGQTDAVLGGYIAEHWHAGTYNAAAVAAGKLTLKEIEDGLGAHALGSTGYGSVDIRLRTRAGETIDYSSKYMATAEKSAVEQSLLDRSTGAPKYHDQRRLVPSDHLEEAKIVAGTRASKDAVSRPEVAAAYADTKENLTDVVSDSEGISSTGMGKDSNLDAARRVKRDEFKSEDFGASVDKLIKAEYILKQAVKAGATAAAVTVAIQIAPEIYKAIDYLIKTGQINVQHLKQMGTKAVSAGAEGFLRGSISCSVLIMCEKGMLGEAFRGADPTMVGTIVAVVLETVKNSIMVAAGKMTAREMGAAFTDSVIVSAGYVAGAKIGGIIGQALGFELPVIGYMIGSLVGCAFAAVYNIGKNKLISFCVDTGFTCFGLVEQNYELPEEVLAQMGVETITIPRTEVPRTSVKTTAVPTINVARTEHETIGFALVRRGVIGVNKIGYVLK